MGPAERVPGVDEAGGRQRFCRGTRLVLPQPLRSPGRALTSRSALPEGTKSIDLDAADMEIREVHREGGAVLGHRLEGELLTIDLDRIPSAGQELALVIRYEATPKSGLHFVGPYPDYPERLQLW